MSSMQLAEPPSISEEEPGFRGTENHPSVQAVIQQIRDSKLFTEFHQAFSDLTGLPLALYPRDHVQAPFRTCSHTNPFCSIVGNDPQARSTCLDVQSKLIKSSTKEGQRMSCPFGMVDMAVPVFIGAECQAYLYTGQMFTRQPSPAKVRRAVQQLSKWNLTGDIEEIKQTYEKGAVISQKQQKALLRLLAHFSNQLGEQANRVFLEERHAEPPLIKRAKKLLQKNYTKPITLDTVSQQLNVSSFYFCKQFKKYVGMNFTEYVARLRIESAKKLLQNPHIHVNEIAFETGFNSLPHFNRSFKRITGVTPTELRKSGKIKLSPHSS
jgi:AraC-like DNA-binding protein